MNMLTARMNDVLLSWKARYDILSSAALEFQVDGQMRLCFNNRPLCLITDLELDNARYDAERIIFTFQANRRIQITITWPEEAAPYASSVFLGYYGLNQN